MTTQELLERRGIKALDPTERMQTAWLRDLDWPRDSAVISRLSREDFRAWVYGLDPRDALILSCYESQFAALQKRKRNLIYRLIDWAWRVRHGYA